MGTNLGNRATQFSLSGLADTLDRTLAAAR